MITEKDLQAAIAECQGQRNPNASTCIKLAAFYTIRNELFGNSEQLPSYSYSAGPPVFDSDSEFGEAIRGKDTTEVLQVMDELMQTVEVLNPKLYASVLRKLK